MAMLGLPYRDCTKRHMPKRWFGKSKHTHIALDDAIEQGELFCNMLCENNSPVSADDLDVLVAERTERNPMFPEMVKERQEGKKP
jgi:hypothetical protein